MNTDTHMYVFIDICVCILVLFNSPSTNEVEEDAAEPQLALQQSLQPQAAKLASEATFLSGVLQAVQACTRSAETDL